MVLTSFHGESGMVVWSKSESESERHGESWLKSIGDTDIEENRRG